MRLLARSTAVLAIVALAACEKPPAQTTPSEGKPVDVAYACGGGKTLKANYPDARTAVVTWEGQTFTLTLAESASGSRYTGGGREWWIKAYPDREEGTLSPSPSGAAAGGPAIAVCSKAPTPGTGQTTPPPATTPVALAGCKSGDLSLKAIGHDAGAGQRQVVYAFTNTSGAACSLKGYATAAWLDADGKPLDGVTVLQSEGDIAEVQLAPGGRAVFSISFTGIQATDKACVTTATLRATPPGNTQVIQIADAISPCTDHITLNPIRAFRDGDASD